MDESATFPFLAFWRRRAVQRTLLLCVDGVTVATRKASAAVVICFGIAGLLPFGEAITTGTGLHSSAAIIVLAPLYLLAVYVLSFGCGWILASITIPANFLLLWLARGDIAKMDDTAVTRYGCWHGLRVYGAYLVMMSPALFKRGVNETTLLMVGIISAILIPVALYTGIYTVRAMKIISLEAADAGQDRTAL